MLVVISDLHLTDGSSGATISSGAFDIFIDRLREAAYSASWRSDGRYRPIHRVDIVLLGDVLDVIRSSRWGSNAIVRPWSSPNSAEFIDQVTRITSDILRHNDESLRVLRELAGEGGLELPPADRNGQPVAGETNQPVEVRIFYMTGNHDWMFHLPGSSYDLLRHAVVRHLGLSNLPNEPFPHDPVENDELHKTMRQHRVFARHGDIYDPFNFEGDRDTSSLGDAIVVELLNRFASAVELELGNELPPSTLMGLRELDNVRPLLLVPVWIDGLLERTCSFPSQRKQVKQVWDQLAQRFLDLRVVRERDTWHPADLVDGLQRALQFSRGVSIGWASQVLTWLAELRVPGEGDFYKHALAEQEFRNRRAKHIVYGHTHAVEQVPLDASFSDGHTLNQMYFNSGTWRRVHRQTRLAPSESEFIATEVMTYLSFYQGDERSGHPFETWTGNLGIPPSDTPVHRIDIPRGSHASGQSTSTSGLHRHAPHFTPPSIGGGVVPTRRFGRV